MNKKNVLTYTGGGGGLSTGFTMAEILLSLTIIGVVAAITLPSLTGNINERTWNTQRKALYARFSQAVALMPALNGYGTFDDTADTAAETFVTAGLSKVLKINNICDSEHLPDCGIPTSFTNLAGRQVSTFPKNIGEMNSLFTGPGIDGTINPQKDINTKAAAFETQNGESIVVYYNPNCESDMQEVNNVFAQTKMCANFVYDLNGNKGPNTVGKDIGFISVLYPSDSIVVSPQPLTNNVSNTGSSTNTSSLCKTQDADSRAPNRDELSAMFYNMKFLGIERGLYWSTAVRSSTNNMWHQSFDTGRRYLGAPGSAAFLRCVKRN